MSQQFISFKLKGVSLKEDTRREFVNLDQVRLITIRPETIFFFDNQGAISVSKDDHPTAYEAIRHFLLNKLEGNYNIIEED